MVKKVKLMRYSEKELKKILENHKHWIFGDCHNWENMQANLCGIDLSRANLRGVELCGANLCGADLRGADLSGANLRSVNLSGANLREVALCGANLYKANLQGADLHGANLRGVDLSEANLHGVDLCRADLNGAIHISFVPYACPDFGAFIGFKKAYSEKKEKIIVVLEIPEDAKRLSATGRKCRCNKAKVLEIQTLEGEKANIDKAISMYNKTFIYKVGEIVSVDNFDEDRWNECSTGIHFFINRQEAVNSI